MSASTALDVLESLEAMGTKRSPKEALLRAHVDNPVLREIFRLTYDWLISYYVTDVLITDDSKEQSRPGRITVRTFEDFKDILEKLSSREISGHEARDVLSVFFSDLSILERKWYRRVIQRDLKINVNVSTLKKVWPGLVTSYEVQLATTVKDPSKIVWPLAVEPKYDGFRITVVTKDGVGSCFTRNGRKQENLQFIADRVSTILPNAVVDGEIYHQSWNTVAKCVTTDPENLTPQKRKDLERCVFWVFDIVDPVGFSTGFDPKPLHERRLILESIDWPVGIRIVPQSIASSYDEALERYADHVAQGYEGVMLKSLTDGYACGRGDSWLKIKPDETIDAEVVGCFEGTGKHEGRLGAFLVRLDDGTEAHVGSGLKDHERDLFWDQRDDLIGKVIEFKAQKETGADRVATVRFPRFVRFRPDKD